MQAKRMLLAVVLVGGLATSGQAAQDVTINNPPSNPVNTKVTNPPSNPVNVTVTNTPLAVTSTEQRTPYSNINSEGRGCGNEASNACVVPPGKQLVIEYISTFFFRAPSSDQVLLVTLQASDPPLIHHFIATKVISAGPGSSTVDQFVFSSPVTLRLNPNASFYTRGGIEPPNVTGYLIDAP